MLSRQVRHVIALVLAAAVAAGCGAAKPGETQRSAPTGQKPAEGQQAVKIKVVTSFYPMFFLTSKIGGDRVDVSSLVTSGVEPHDWEPTAKDIKALNGAQVFVYNGAGFETWVKRTVGSLDNKGLIQVDTSQGLELLESEEHEEEHHEEADPHIWLDPVHNQHQVKLITDALVKADPAGKATYEANAKGLAEKFQGLDSEYQTLASCNRKEIVISHAFFAYPAKRYGLKQLSVIGSMSPDAEPTPKEMAELVKFVREHNIRHIFFETLASDKVAKVIASEAGAKTLVLNPLEGLTREEEAQGKDFFAVARDNLANLKVALECK